MSATVRPRIAQSGAAQENACLGGILLHGRQRTPEEMIALAGRLDLDGIHWVAPAAAQGSWYPNRFMEPIASNEPHFSRALARIHEMVNLASDQGRLKPDQLAIVGFSQGACLAAEYAVRNPGRVRNIVMFTGSLFGPSVAHWIRTGRSLHGTRILITGSDVDDWVPEPYVRETARVLTELGAEVRLRMYHGRPHVVSPLEIAEARSFLAGGLVAGLASRGACPSVAA